MARYPPAADVDAAVLRGAVIRSGRMAGPVVLDDDPTGTQTVTDVPVVVTRWTTEDLRWALAQPARPRCSC